MSRIMAWLGLLLILSSCGVMALLIQSGDLENDPNPLEELAADWFCEENERIQSWSVTTNGNQTTEFHCVNSDRTRQAEVTNQMAGFIVAGTTIPFVLGLALILVATSRNKPTSIRSREQMEDVLREKGFTPVRTQYKAIKMEDLNISDDHRELIQDILGTVVGATQPPKSDLSSRLEQLKAAHDKGLITDDEYQQTRQAILDAMDDDL